MRIVLILILLQSVVSVYGQQKAVTETGDEVILLEDGTWQYQNKIESETTEILINEKKFEKSKNASFLLKSNKMSIGFWLNPKLWSFKKAIDNPDAEYELQLKKGDLYGMIITEKN